LAGCEAPLNCSNPSDPNQNIFNAGRTVPIKIVLNPPTPSADIRLTITDADGNVFLGESAGHSNTGNQFKRTGHRFEFNWSTKGLPPGVYMLTISPGTNSGDLFPPTSILVTLR
jgi:hypothetical protein